MSFAAATLPHPSATDGTLGVAAGVRALTLEASIALRSLEVTGGEDLEVLDLSALPDDLMLYVCGLPRLRHVLLPRGTGCHVHLALASPPALRIDGDIAWVDACWPHGSGEATLSASWNEHARGLRQSVLRGAWLGPAASAPTDVDLLCVCGDGSSSIELGQHRAVCVVIEDVPALDALAAGAHQLVAVRNAPALRTVQVKHTAALLVDDALRIQEVRGDGAQLSLRDSARVETLVVDGAWEQLFIHREGPRRLLAAGTRHFHSELIHRLQHRDCAVGLAQKTKRPSRSGEALLQSVIQELLQGVPLSPAMKTAASTAHQKLGPQRVLEALVGVAGPNTAARLADIWSLRMMMARGHRKAAGKPNLPATATQGPPQGDDSGAQQGPGWTWHFPLDLADRGWRSDLRLWAVCRGATASARDFEAVIRRSSDPEHLAAVADAAREQHGQPRGAASSVPPAPWLAILEVQLDAGIAQGLYMPIPPETSAKRRRGLTREAEEQLRAAASPQIVLALQGVLRAFVRLREHPDVPRLVNRLCDWIVRRIPNSSGVKVLAAMHALGAGRATAGLSSIVAHPHARPEVRHEALMAALVAPQQHHLAFPESHTHGPTPGSAR